MAQLNIFLPFSVLCLLTGCMAVPRSMMGASSGFIFDWSYSKSQSNHKDCTAMIQNDEPGRTAQCNVIRVVRGRFHSTGECVSAISTTNDVAITSCSIDRPHSDSLSSDTGMRHQTEARHPPLSFWPHFA